MEEETGEGQLHCPRQKHMVMELRRDKALYVTLIDHTNLQRIHLCHLFERFFMMLLKTGTSFGDSLSITVLA